MRNILTSRILIMLLLGGAAPIFGGLVLEDTFPGFRWEHHPSHAVVEGIGAFAAVIIAILIMFMRSSGKLPPSYIWFACGLMGMGVLDGFHAVLHVGETFVWTHSLATFVGGVFFALIWLPEGMSKSQFAEQLPYFTLLLALGAGFASIAFPHLLPLMVTEHNFTFAARGLNIIGGLGFLLAAGYFTFGQVASIGTEKTVFSTHAFLFGVAGLLFELSQLWDSPWWLWHILRLVAYLVAMYYFLSVFFVTIKQLSKSHEHLKKALEKERELSALQKQFVSLVSHEFRTPLSIIDSTAQRILRRSSMITPDELKIRSSKIRVAVERMTALIEKTLHLSRLDAGQIEFSPEKFNIKETIKEICDHHAETFPDHDIHIEIDSMPDLVVADGALLDQVFINLLSNAIKYSPGGGRIDIMGQTQNDHVLISVRDQGLGIAKDELPQMFNRFFRTKSSTGISGTGIGLSLCREFVKMHGGDIWVNSQEGNGSTFTVRIPIRG